MNYKCRIIKNFVILQKITIENAEIYILWKWQ